MAEKPDYEFGDGDFGGLKLSPEQAAKLREDMDRITEMTRKGSENGYRVIGATAIEETKEKNEG